MCGLRFFWCWHLVCWFLQEDKSCHDFIDRPEHGDVSRCGWLVVQVCNFATKVSEDRTLVLMLSVLIVYLMVYLGAGWDNPGVCVVCVWCGFCVRVRVCVWLFSAWGWTWTLSHRKPHITAVGWAGRVCVVNVSSFIFLNMARHIISLAVLKMLPFFSNW